MERKLVTIRIISKIIPIKNADFIELAFVDGWQCIVKKDEFKAGDKALYFEIDSFLPIRSEFEFLRKSHYKKIQETGEEGFRLRTIRLRDQISQGLLLPIDTFPEINTNDENTDLSEILSVKKWDPPLPAQISGIAKGVFPSFIPKTDVERIQNLINEYPNKYRGKIFEVSIKVDGTSMTVYKKDDIIGVCSRNLELKENDDNSLWKVAKKGPIQSLQTENKNYALQGELVGPGIQKNPEKLKELTFFIFEIFDIDKQSYLSSEDRIKFVNKYSLNHVPILDTVDFFNKYNTIDEILASSKGKSLQSDIREGIVCKLINKGNIKFKIINNDYLLFE